MTSATTKPAAVTGADPAASAEPGPAAPKKWLGPAIIGLALVLGAALGKFAIAPRLASAPASAPTEEAGGASGHGTETKPSLQVRIDNIVVNPLGSQGSRFIMASVVFEVADASAEAGLRARESEVRDLISAVIGARTLERLTMAGARDSLKLSLADSARHLLPPGSTLRVLLPQFVIQ
jgi:flagellar basal body-associated protein FliL